MSPPASASASLSRVSATLSRRVTARRTAPFVLPIRSASTKTKSKKPSATASSTTTASTSKTTKFSPNGLPPESPSFIHIAPQPQSTAITPERVRGSLPVPKRIFTRRETTRKVLPQYINKTAPPPTSAAALRPVAPGSPAEYRRLMAATRRENLEVGLQGLWKRKLDRDQAAESRANARFAANRAASLAPEREDERITRPSVSPALADTTGGKLAVSTAVLPDPERFAKAEASAVRTAELVEKKREERRDALMELYVNARSFIVTEAQLKERCEELFAEDYFQREGKDTVSDPDNAWSVWGQPESLSRMMMASQNRPMDFALGSPTQASAHRTVMRQKKVAEELTGGKME